MGSGGELWGKIPKKEKCLFRGQFTYSVDAKGRVSIPAKLRRQVSPEAGDTFIIKKGIGICIEIFPLDIWLKQEEKLKELNPYNPEHAKFIRMSMQYVSEDSLDSQSRILIPQNLLEFAKIEKEVMILGALEKIELWSPKVYEEYLNQTTETYEDIAIKVMVR